MFLQKALVLVIMMLNNEMSIKGSEMSMGKQ